MSDTEMQIDDNMHEEHQGGLAGQQRYEHSAEPSMGGETSGDETSVHEEELEEEDPEALVEMDPKAILAQRIRPNPSIDYTSQEALQKAGLTREDLEKKDEDDPEFVAVVEGDPGEVSEGDVSMQQ